MTLKDVGIARLDPGRFQAVLDPEDCRRLLGPVGAGGRAIQTLLTDRDQAQRLGVAAHRRVGQEYLAPRRLTQELDLIDRVAG